MTGPGADFGQHGEWDALAVGWALSALESDDKARLAAHLAGCARCTETVREAVWTVTDLAYAVPDEPPPGRLKRQILDLAAAEPPRSAASDRGTGPRWPPAEEQVPAGAAEAGRRRRWSPSHHGVAAGSPGRPSPPRWR